MHVQVRLAAGLLGALAGRPHALRLLLASHSARLKRAQTLLLKPQNAGAPCLLMLICTEVRLLLPDTLSGRVMSL
jgi:hypothetical protein